ncbi:uncharacterized protein LOC111945602 isoform X2 [Cyanistes caeruleus]|uniref:uncharacterized protein LOC111945602 isoform X2 n=1 Tax=Cyanistes caeruleus TaxID=156563 RepID=UPI000CDA460A|nr:uncharacterized protein LOC111945602 isoform X2 [Cyanistes caeruleus]
MAFALRLFLLLLLAVALPDRAAQAAPWRAQGADEGGRKASPAAWLHEDFLPLEPHAGVSAARTFQAPFLVAARKPSSHHGGSLRGRNKPTEDKMLSELDRRYEMNPKAVLKAAFPGGSSGSWAASAAGREAMPGTVPGDKGGRKAPPAAWLHEDFKPLEPHAGVSASRTFQAPFLVAARKPSSHHRGSPRGRNKPTEDKMNPKAVLKVPFPGGSSGSWAASAAGREAMPGTVPGDWDGDMEHLEVLVNGGLKTLPDAGDEPDDEDDPDSQSISVTEPDDEEDYEDAAGTTAHAQKIWESMRRVFYQGTDGLIKLMAIVAGGAVFLMMCCAGIWYCWKGKRSTSAASEEQPKIPVSEKLTCYPRSPHLSLSAVLQLQPRLEGIPRPTPPKRDPLPLSPLALFPGQD